MKDLIYYLNLKKQQDLNDLEKHKIDLITTYLKKPEIFFQMSLDIVYNIFDFLQIPDDKRLIIYQELISPESYQQLIPQNRTLIDPEKLSK